MPLATKPVWTTKTKSGTVRLPSGELAELYVRANDFVSSCGFGDEIEAQRKRNVSRITETEFLSEAAWVVLSSGLRESVVRSKFAPVSKAFHYFNSAQHIALRSSECRSAALAHFAHRGKIDAIVVMCAMVAEIGFRKVLERLRSDGPEALEGLPYLGPATSLHLAKNIGFDVVKPDRHLLRIAACAGYENPDTLCRVIANETGDSVSTIDSVLWRYATLRADYEIVFSVWPFWSNSDSRQDRTSHNDQPGYP